MLGLLIQTHHLQHYVTHDWCMGNIFFADWICTYRALLDLLCIVRWLCKGAENGWVWRALPTVARTCMLTGCLLCCPFFCGCVAPSQRIGRTPCAAVFSSRRVISVSMQHGGRTVERIPGCCNLLERPVQRQFVQLPSLLGSRKPTTHIATQIGNLRMRSPMVWNDM